MTFIKTKFSQRDIDTIIYTPASKIKEIRNKYKHIVMARVYNNPGAKVKHKTEEEKRIARKIIMRRYRDKLKREKKARENKG